MIFGQKCQCWAKFGHFWAKNPNFMGVSKSFGTNITENHQDNLSVLFFGQALDKMCKGWQYLAQNDQKCRFWTKFGHFWAKQPNFYGRK